MKANKRVKCQTITINTVICKILLWTLQISQYRFWFSQLEATGEMPETFYHDYSQNVVFLKWKCNYFEWLADPIDNTFSRVGGFVVLRPPQLHKQSILHLQRNHACNYLHRIKPFISTSLFKKYKWCKPHCSWFTAPITMSRRFTASQRRTRADWSGSTHSQQEERSRCLSCTTHQYL